MFRSTYSMAKSTLVAALVTISLFSPAMLRAEPTIHKVKKKLHKVEQVTGIVLSQTGEVMLDGLSHVAVAIILVDDDEVGSHEKHPAHNVGLAKPDSEHHHESAKPAESSHPAK